MQNRDTKHSFLALRENSSCCAIDLGRNPQTRKMQRLFLRPSPDVYAQLSTTFPTNKSRKRCTNTFLAPTVFFSPLTLQGRNISQGRSVGQNKEFVPKRRREGGTIIPLRTLRTLLRTQFQWTPPRSPLSHAHRRPPRQSIG